MSLLLLFNQATGTTYTDSAVVSGVAVPSTASASAANGAFVANRGSGIVNGTFSLTWTFVTSGAVASGDKVILAIRTSSGVTISSITGGGLTWTVEIQRDNSGANGGCIQIASADAPAG